MSPSRGVLNTITSARRCFNSSRQLLSDEKVTAHISTSLSPFTNLAYEDHLFRTSSPDAHTLLLYRNRSAVIIGRNQNPWKEANLSLLHARNIALVRRRSGGGAVYHEEGNTCWSVGMAKKEFDRVTNVEMVTRALRSLGVRSRVNERHDIVIDTPEGETLKVTGSAYKLARERAYHHGTMLLNADLAALGGALRSTRAQGIVDARSVESVRSRVGNVGIPHDDFCAAVKTEFEKLYNEGKELEWKVFGDHTLEEIPEVKKLAEELQSWNWTFGQTPQFTHELNGSFHWSDVTVILTVKHGVIIEAKVEGNSIDDGIQTRLSSVGTSLVGKQYGRESVRLAVMEGVEDSDARGNARLKEEELSEWLSSQLD
ncbi:Lipoyltransferase and lipoate-protein ligase [Saitoella complicata NRRL Y-17804]|uniref:Putative lipoate-protein ligase A n=1 Tax=Saitoella complicata (strain BCRC 22490 / CBS 7301 / JCM 7358 / NBRC 10748 / NRRL Y-17804) TaxID=698492 RepID=A0A0E9N7M3_SAICN|nr:Lipoyltransferase and lipoate-protein ligase [Saitoella complicata NRRL Y-17804]ODQ54376.1 Lipoyltransferase and lipoate-protein ligase [Saitoella complicata NRRL Y-17804]GAO45834.1 hypothetical protein G7K_0083-t1 [Saitoella complicata NRRL Y-17804]